jgi:hypothetical protein
MAEVIVISICHKFRVIPIITAVEKGAREMILTFLDFFR